MAASNFNEIKQDLRTLPASNTSHNEHYLKAAQILTQADQWQAQGKPLNVKQQANIKQAVALLQKLAKAGNTNAMIALGLCYFEGQWLTLDSEQGVQWIKKAAESNDMRAQKLLSRLYYQGLGVKMSADMGEQWLDKAAANGHSEAQKLQAQFRQIRLMKEEVQVEANKDKQYFVLLAMVGVVFILLFWLMAKYL